MVNVSCSSLPFILVGRQSSVLARARRGVLLLCRALCLPGQLGVRQGTQARVCVPLLLSRPSASYKESTTLLPLDPLVTFAPFPSLSSLR